jgi:ankyrin repeat protein
MIACAHGEAFQFCTNNFQNTGEPFASLVRARGYHHHHQGDTRAAERPVWLGTAPVGAGCSGREHPIMGLYTKLAKLLRHIAVELPEEVHVVVLRDLPTVEIARLACAQKAFWNAWMALRLIHPRYAAPEHGVLEALYRLTRFVRAASLGDVAVLRVMVVTGEDEQGEPLVATPSIPARRTARTAQVSPPTPQVDQALLAAVSAGHTQAVELLIAAGAQVDGGDGEALRSAAQNGHVEVLRVLLSASVDTDALDVLLAACSSGHLSVVQLLVDRGVDMRAGQDAALREACARGHADIAQFLIDRGADVHAEDDEAMHEASANGHQHIVLLLTQHAIVQERALVASG